MVVFVLHLSICASSWVPLLSWTLRRCSFKLRFHCCDHDFINEILLPQLEGRDDSVPTVPIRGTTQRVMPRELTTHLTRRTARVI
ncbi:hypothetical protein LENED_008759 [Lentinula edodes]|uniref:Secreted protein n=1 Tax=Lentinula edodes TaxID=5353 RepID=A0A1Q3EI03_LENED|nr:hypothetical protein LENED_008759 [Lentinula edodes]